MVILKMFKKKEGRSKGTQHSTGIDKFFEENAALLKFNKFLNFYGFRFQDTAFKNGFNIHGRCFDV